MITLYLHYVLIRVAIECGSFIPLFVLFAWDAIIVSAWRSAQKRGNKSSYTDALDHWEEHEYGTWQWQNRHKK